MKFKYCLSSALALVMTFSLSIPVFAADYETSVSFEGTGTEQYELIVPAQLKPGTSGDVTLSGTWASNRHIAVTADESVTMTGSLGGSETLDVTFAGIDLAGNNEVAVSETKQVSVADLDALFGNWTGTFYYNVGASNVGNTIVDPDSGSGSGGTTNPDGTSSPSDPLAGVDLSQATAFTVIQENRAAVGYTGEADENLVIPAYFVGDGENGTADGQVYKVTSIGVYSFYNCSNLASVTVPEWVTSIGNYAFRNCSNLTSVSIPEGVTSIGDGAFRNCTKLTSITIPEGVTSIGTEAFYGCSKLTSVTIPESVTSIGEKVFNGCSKLTSINASAENNNYSSDDGILFNKNKTKLIRYPQGKSGTTYTIPSSVTSIGDSAFYGCSNLTSITVPEWVTSIGDNAFLNCSNLTSVSIPEGVSSIGSAMFFGCSNLTNVIIPDGVTSIGNDAFGSCSKLTGVTIPESVMTIGDYTFYNCGVLERVTFNGTQVQWDSISKGQFWNGDTGSYIVYCTDGNIAK